MSRSLQVVRVKAKVENCCRSFSKIGSMEWKNLSIESNCISCSKVPTICTVYCSLLL